MVPSDPGARLRAHLADRYRLDGELGRGGMALVYRAWDLRHDRPVAIKLLRPELAASGRARQRPGAARGAGAAIGRPST